MKNLLIKRILIPVDYSEESAGALTLAAAMSRRHNAVLRLIHIISPDTYPFPDSNGMAISMSPEEVILSEVPKLKRWVDAVLKDTPAQYFVECRTGVVSERIVDVAHEVGADLIVMGAGKTTGIRDYFMGSVVGRVLETSSCPVLTVPGPIHTTDFKEVLFPLRQVEGVLDKYEYARRIVQKNKARLTVLALFNNQESDKTSLLTRAITQLDKRLRADSISADMLVTETDSVAETLLRKSEDLQTSLIVITATTETSISHLFKGTFARQVIRKANVPVLSVRPNRPAEKTILPVRGGIKSMQRIFSLVQTR